jgi:hypothetical protein
MILRTAIALALLAVAANAAELSLGNGIVAPGKPAALGVTLSSGKDAPTGFQFDLEFDPAALDISVEPGPGAQQASKSLQSAAIRAGKLRVLIIGFNRNTIPDGVLALVHVSYKSGDTGKTFPIHLTASSGTNANAETVAVTVKDGGVRTEK